MSAVLAIEERPAARLIEKRAQLPQPRRSYRYASLDAWRGVACLLVVLYHSTLIYLGETSANTSQTGVARSVLAWLHYGNLGVPMFFVISGYCIAATARASQERGTSLATYFWRRFKRIYPPYWMALALVVLLFLAVDIYPVKGLLSSRPWSQYRPWWFSPSQWLGNVTLTETWRHWLGGSARGHIVGQSWTLCYEEQFYLVVGALLLFRARVFFPLCAVVTAGCIVAQQTAHAWKIPIAGFFFDGNWISFALGIAVFYATNHLAAAGQAVVLVLLAAGAPLIGLLPGLGGRYLEFSLLFAAGLIALRRFDRAIAGAAIVRPLLVCGTMCYSLYLVHQILVAGISRGLYWSGVTSAWATLIITVPACLTVSLIAGWSFYQVVERRFLNSTVAVSG